MTDAAFIKNMVTGGVVGTINVIMLILNIIMVVSFAKNMNNKETA
ncbi:hypothetical protein MASR2M78_26890 [Treponema sp.]